MDPLRLPMEPLRLRYGHALRNRRPQLPRPPTEPEAAAASSSSSSEEEPTPRSPSNLHDIHTTIRYLRHAFHRKLPDELLKHILYLADYDCLHFTAASSQEVTCYGGYAGTKLSEATAYIETRPLSCLSEAPDGGRIRSLTLRATGKDQGWVGDRSSAPWSWLEMRKRKDTSDNNEWRGFTWAWNRVAETEWQHHELSYHVDDDAVEGKEHIASWVHGLQNGDRVSIVPMAQYGGWECNVKEASIDVEVEAWR